MPQLENIETIEKRFWNRHYLVKPRLYGAQVLGETA